MTTYRIVQHSIQVDGFQSEEHAQAWLDCMRCAEDEETHYTIEPGEGLGGGE